MPGLSAPRLNIGAYTRLADQPAERVLSAFEAVGHSVEIFSIPQAAGDFEAVMIVADFSALPRAVTELAESIHRGQIVLHLGLARGASVLEDLEARGAVVGNLSPVRGTDHGAQWVTDALDDVGRAVVTSLVEEVGGRPLWLDSRERSGVVALRCREAAIEELGRATSLAGYGVGVDLPLFDSDTAGPEAGAPFPYACGREEFAVARGFVAEQEGEQAAKDLETLVALARRASRQAPSRSDGQQEEAPGPEMGAGNLSQDPRGEHDGL